YGPQNDVTLKMPAFEWVHVQLHQQKGMISLSPPTICNSAAMGMSRAKWYRLGKPSPQQNSETSPSPITNGEASAVALQAARCKAV
ncbi:hypothetical protein L6P87_25460, partial [Klebsiella pneumoniae]|nr:hypothetical protein [Klebsiella pneumoniae]